MKLITSLRGPGLQLHLSRPSSPDSACYRKSRRADLRPRRALARLRATPKQTILIRVANSEINTAPPGKATTTKPKPTSNVPKTTVTPPPQKKRKLRVSSPKVHRFETLKTQLDRGNIAQDDDDEDMPVPELLDIRDVQGELAAAVSP